MICVLLRRGSLLSEVGRQGSARYAIEWKLGEQRGGRRDNGSHDYHGTNECNTHSRGAKRDAKATSNLERWGKSSNPSVLWAETALADRPGCNNIHQNWRIPSQEILNATTTAGANQGAWGLGGGKSTLQAYAGLAWGGLLNLSARILGECHHRG